MLGTLHVREGNENSLQCHHVSLKETGGKAS